MLQIHNWSSITSKLSFCWLNFYLYLSFLFAYLSCIITDISSYLLPKREKYIFISRKYKNYFSKQLNVIFGVINTFNCSLVHFNISYYNSIVFHSYYLFIFYVLLLRSTSQVVKRKYNHSLLRYLIDFLLQIEVVFDVKNTYKFYPIIFNFHLYFFFRFVLPFMYNYLDLPYKLSKKK